jgi:hypothetical protein
MTFLKLAVLEELKSSPTMNYQSDSTAMVNPRGNLVGIADTGLCPDTPPVMAMFG